MAGRAASRRAPSGELPFADRLLGAALRGCLPRGVFRGGGVLFGVCCRLPSGVPGWVEFGLGEAWLLCELQDWLGPFCLVRGRRIRNVDHIEFVTAGLLLVIIAGCRGIGRHPFGRLSSRKLPWAVPLRYRPPVRCHSPVTNWVGRQPLGFRPAGIPRPAPTLIARPQRARRMSSRTPRRRKGRPCHDTAPPAAKIGSATHSMKRWLRVTAQRGFEWRSTGCPHPPPLFVVELWSPPSRLALLPPPLPGRRSRPVSRPPTTSRPLPTARTPPPLSAGTASVAHPLPRQRC